MIAVYVEAYLKKQSAEVRRKVGVLSDGWKALHEVPQEELAELLERIMPPSARRLLEVLLASSWKRYASAICDAFPALCPGLGEIPPGDVEAMTGLDRTTLERLSLMKDAVSELTQVGYMMRYVNGAAELQDPGLALAREPGAIVDEGIRAVLLFETIRTAAGILSSCGFQPSPENILRITFELRSVAVEGWLTAMSGAST